MNRDDSTFFQRKLGEAIKTAWFFATEILQIVWNKSVDLICLLYVAFATFQNWLFKRNMKIEEEAVKDWWMVLCERGRTSPESLMGAFLIMFSMGAWGLIPRFQCSGSGDEKVAQIRAVSATAKLVHTVPFYFQLVPQQPGEFLFKNAITLAVLSNFAYASCALAELSKRLWGITAVYPFHGRKTNTEGIVFATDYHVCVAFKGTGNLYDLLTDMRFDRYVIQNFMVHHGMCMAVSEVASDLIQCINKMLEDNPQRKLFITGHSLGGGLAILFAAKYMMSEETAQPKALEGIYTFAAPRVGDRAFAEAYNALLKEKTFRVVNYRDFVPSLPPFGYKHVGVKVFIDRKGNIHKKTHREFVETLKESIYKIEAAAFGISLLPHKMITYIYRITEATKSSY